MTLYYTVYKVEPLYPFDIIEATFLVVEINSHLLMASLLLFIYTCSKNMMRT